MTAIEKAWREYVVYLAQSYIGCKESDGSHKKIVDLYNSHKPLARGYTLKYTDSWCSGFASAIAIKAGLTDIIPTEVGCEKHVQLFKNHPISKWEEDGTKAPEPGDYIFYNWDKSSQPNDGSADHVGIVERVNNNVITTIEGNYSDSVKRRTLIVGAGNIRGYGRPAYWTLKTMPPSYERDTSATSTTALLKRGDRNDAVRALQNNLISLGYSCGSAGADGDFGPGTEAAVRSFQSKNGLTVDGIAGPATLTAIQTALKKASQPTITTSKLKYTNSNPPFVCMQKNSTCYKGTGKMQIKGVLWHSTGANNPWLKRYVQPYEGDSGYNEAIAKLGKNVNKNDWNHITRQAGLNAWVGKMGDGVVGCVQTMPWDYRPWGCGSGPKGSCNDGWIQFEICEDSLTNETYLKQVYEEACQLTAYLCKKYNIDPNGTINFKGVNVPTILCHADSNALGLGSNHGDINHWFPKFGKSMATVRADVAKLMNATSSSTSSNISNSSTTKVQLYRIRKTWTDSKTQMGAYSSLENAKKACDKLGGDYKVFDAEGKVIYTPAKPFTPYIVRVNVEKLNVRAQPNNTSKIVMVLNKGAYTIVEEKNGFGKLKSGAGWIDLAYTTKK